MTITDTTDRALGRRHPDRVLSRGGAGTAIILIDPALSTHKGSAKLSKPRSPTRFSAISYDRRGRGASGDEQPTPPIRRARSKTSRRSIDAAGGRAILFGIVLGGRARARGGRQAGRPRQRRSCCTSRRSSATTAGRRWHRTWRRGSRHPSPRAIARPRPGPSSSRRSGCRASRSASCGCCRCGARRRR